MPLFPNCGSQYGKDLFSGNKRSLILSTLFRFSTDFQMPIVPMSFLDCEKRYPYHFSYGHYVGGPGILRVRVHNHISTKGKGLEDMEGLKQQVYDLLWNDLED